jgi:hypothetical protein
VDPDAQHRRARRLDDGGPAVQPRLTAARAASAPSRSAVALAAAPLTAAAVGVFADGGYGDGARVAFGVVALAAALPAAVLGQRSRTRPEAVVLLLLALAALGALSALWTLGPPDRSLRWALVTAGYAAVALAASAAARRRGGVELLAGGIAALAIAAGATGLVAAAAHVEPYALRIAGSWRPGGPFEYPPALALLAVSGLPALLAGMTHRSRALAAVAAAGMAIAGGVLALAASRTGLALAVLVAGAALAFAPVTLRASRAVVAAACGLAVAAGAVLGLGNGAASEAARLAALAAAVGLAAPLWLAARRVLDRGAADDPPRRVDPLAVRSRGGRCSHLLAAATALLALAALAGALAFGPAAGRGAGPASGFLHGRSATWSAAAQTFADRPLAGAGADAFLAGSARHQRGQTVVFAHSLPLELAAELGVAGLVLALCLYAAAGRALWHSRSSRATWLLGPASAAFLLAGLLDWPWHLAGAGAVWALATGAIGTPALAGNAQKPGRCLALGRE